MNAQKDMKESLAFKAGIVDYRYECGTIRDNDIHRVCFSDNLNLVNAAYQSVIEVAKQYKDIIVYLYDYELDEYIEKYDPNDYD